MKKYLIKMVNDEGNRTQFVIYETDCPADLGHMVAVLTHGFHDVCIYEEVE